jgi:hypothetical protein
LFKRNSLISRWKRAHRSTGGTQDFERLTQQRLYGERRGVSRLVEQRSSTPSSELERGGVEDPAA